MKVFVNNPNKAYATKQESVTQGLDAILIHNLYTNPIDLFIEDRAYRIDPGQAYRYRGYYALGIPFGEIVETTYDTIIIDQPLTDLLLGNF